MKKSKHKAERRTKAKAKSRFGSPLPPNVGLLISGTDTGTAGTGAGVWDKYITDFKGAICTNNVTYYEHPGSPGHYGAGGDKTQYDNAVTQLVHDNVSVIVTGGTLAATECQNQTTTIPLVVASAGDLSVLAGNNFTGCTNGQTNTQILDARITRMNNNWSPVAVMVAGNYDAVPPVKAAMDYVLSQLGNKGHKVKLGNNNADVPNLQATLASLKQPNGVNVLYVCSDPFVRTNGTAIVQAAKAAGYKTMHEFKEWVQQHHGDDAYGPDFTKLFQRAAGYVDQILNGALAANLPLFEPQLSDCV
jgi:putative tryptophan/tyrosine transport system substrate-binding protein